MNKQLMRYLMPRLLLTSLVLLSLMSFMKPDGWYVLRSEQYGYKVDFPQKPVENPQVINTEIGELKMNMFIYDASSAGKDDNLLYLVNYTEYPEAFMEVEDPESVKVFFRNAVDGAVGNVNGRLISEKIIKLGRHPGREIKVDFKEGMAVIRMRFYLVGYKLYMLQTITETKKDFNKSINRFMNSFELLGAGGK